MASKKRKQTAADLKEARRIWVIWSVAMEKLLKLPKGTPIPEILDAAEELSSKLDGLTAWIQEECAGAGCSTLEEYYEEAVKAGQISRDPE